MCKVIWFIKEQSNTVVFDCYTVLIPGLACTITRFLATHFEPIVGSKCVAICKNIVRP